MPTALVYTDIFLGDRSMVQKRLRGIVAYLNTGHGFKSPAVAISQALEAHGVDVECVDLLEAAGEHKPNTFIKKGWDFYLKYPWTFVVTFALLNTPLVHPVQGIFAKIVWKSIARYLRDRQPDFILTTHFVLAADVQLALRHARLPIAFIGYNSEVIISHRSYIAKDVAAYLVATEAGRQGMIDHGLEPEQVIKTSFPIDQKFLKSFGTIAEERAQLGLEDRFTVLVTFGGLGVGSYDLIERLASSGLDVQVVVICGRNEEAQRRIEEIAAAHPDFALHARGFVTNMQDYLYCSDLSAGKAGLNMVFESIYMGKPFLALMAMANERFCARYVAEQGFGWNPRSLDEAYAVIADAAGDLSRLEPIHARLKEHGIDYDTPKMSRTIVEVVDSYKRTRLAGSTTLFFDLAGTLCDIPIEKVWDEVNVGGIRNVFHALGLEAGRSPEEFESLCRGFVERKTVLRKKAKATLEEFEIKAQIQDFLSEANISVSSPDWAEAESLFVSTELEITVAMPDVHRVLAELHRGYRMHVLSNNASTTLVHQILKKLDIAQFFDQVLVSADVGYRKPHETFFSWALAETGARIEETVMIGDRLTQDIVMANRTGMASVYCAMVDHADNVGSEDTPYTIAVTTLPELLELFPRRELSS